MDPKELMAELKKLPTTICEHGNLARQCVHCELNTTEAESDTLRADLARVTSERDAAKRKVEGLWELVKWAARRRMSARNDARMMAREAGALSCDLAIKIDLLSRVDAENTRIRADRDAAVAQVQRLREAIKQVVVVHEHTHGKCVPEWCYEVPLGLTVADAIAAAEAAIKEDK